MINQIVTRVSLESFRERSKGRKVVLLYPWTNYRNLFLSHFLESAEEGLLYYRIPKHITNLNDCLADMANELGQILGNFGDNTRATIDVGASANLGEALATDLNQYSHGEPVILFIDELDRLEFDEQFFNFLEAVVKALPEHVQLVFSSRLLTYQPWYNLVSSGDAVVLGTEYRKNDVMFTVEDTPKPQIEVYAFGLGHALVNGDEITNWDGALPRNLFFYFIDNQLVTRDNIFDMFWPQLSVKEATNVFHVTKRKISERISMKVDDDNNYELTQYASGFYMPSDKVVRHYDVDDFQEAVEHAAASSNEQEQETLYRQAVDLYKAPFLEKLEMAWIKQRRTHLRQLYAQALVGLGRIHRRRNEHEEALGFYTRTLKETPEREDIHREVMQLYLDMNMPDDARQQYHHLTEVLKETFNVEPSAESRTLYESIS